MEEKKYCPFCGRAVDCGGEYCALWNKAGRCCTFASMAWSLRQLIAAVNEQKEDGARMKRIDGANLCPICKGIGNVYPTINSAAMCTACNGTGFVGGEIKAQ